MPRFSILLALAFSLQVAPMGFLENRTPVRHLFSAAAQTKAAAPLRVVVLPFKNITRQPQDDWLSDSFAESLTMGLVKVSDLHLIERAQVQKLIKEQQFSQSALADENTAPQLGKMLGANVVVLGSYQKVGDQLQANVRFVDVETGRVDAAHVEQVEGRFSDIFKLQKKLANNLVQKLDVNATPKEVAAVKAAMTTTTSTAAHRFYIEGLKYMDYQGKSNFVKAVKSFEKALIEDPRYAQAYAGLAEVHAKIAGLEKSYMILPTLGIASVKIDHDALAEKYALKALELKEDMPEVYRAVAKLQHNRRDIKEALTMIKTAIRLNPKDHISFSLYIQIRQEQEAFSLPIDTLLGELKSLGVSQDDPWLKYNLGSYMLAKVHDPSAKKQRKNMISLLKEAERDLPTYPGIPLVLAGAEIYSGHRKEALEHVERVIELSDNHPYYRMAAVQFLGSMGQPKRALTLVEQVNKRFPNNRQIEATYAMILMQNKKFAAGKAIFDRLEKASPDDPFMPFNRGIAAFAYQQDFKKAKYHFKRARDRYKPQRMMVSRGFIDNFLAMAHLNLKEYAEAIALLEPLRNDTSFRRGAYESLSTAYSRLNKHEQALLNYNDYLAYYPDLAKEAVRIRKHKEYQLRYALSKQPKDLALLNDLGQVMQTQHHYNNAKMYYQQALSLEKDHPVILANLGSLYLDLTDYAKAKESLAQAVKVKPDYARAWFNLGLAELGLQHKERARAAFEQVLVLDPSDAGAQAELKKLR